MKVTLTYILSLFVLIGLTAGCKSNASNASKSAQSVRAERKLINEGNELYLDRQFEEAAKKYEEALKVNPESAVSRYNLGLAQLKQVTNPQDTTPRAQNLLKGARQNRGWLLKRIIISEILSSIPRNFRKLLIITNNR